MDAPQCDVGQSAPPYYVLAWGEMRTEDAGAGVGRQWGTCSLGRSGDVGSRAVADAGISGKSGSGSSCLDSHPNRETSLGSIFGMRLGSLRWT